MGSPQSKCTLETWADALPFYTIVKDKLECPHDIVADACAALRKTFTDADAQEGDGLRLDWNDRWVQIRASNTEPILRIIAEAPETEDAKALCRQAMDAVKSVVKA